MLKLDGVIWHTAISLDGFAADVNDSLAFMMEGDVGPPPDNPLVDDVMANLGCTLGGRRGYDISQSWDEVPKAYGLDDIPEIVVTRRPFPNDPRYAFADGNDLPGAVAMAKAKANGRMVVVLGPTLGSAMLRAGLVDDRNAVRLEAVDRAGDEVADGAHLLLLEFAAHLQHDGGGGLDLVARE